MRSLRGFLALAVLVTGCSGGSDTGSTSPAPEAAPAVAAPLTHEVVARHPHDTGAFTQGFVFTDEATLAESAGGYGTSEVRLVDPETGTVRRRAAVPADRFAEGLAFRTEDGELVQLTWREGVAMRWSVDDLSPTGETTYEGEGWGLTEDPDTGALLSTDGSALLSRRDPSTFEVTSAVTVRRAGEPVESLNEIEWVDGAVWANVWQTSEILRIDPATGDVTGVLDLSSLVPATGDPEAVLNGIAHRPGDPPNRLWVTGKRWPEVFVIDVGGAGTS